jgi:hypothetical protein
MGDMLTLPRRSCGHRGSPEAPSRQDAAVQNRADPGAALAAGTGQPRDTSY